MLVLWDWILCIYVFPSLSSHWTWAPTKAGIVKDFFTIIFLMYGKRSGTSVRLEPYLRTNECIEFSILGTSLLRRLPLIGTSTMEWAEHLLPLSSSTGLLLFMEFRTQLAPLSPVVLGPCPPSWLNTGCDSWGGGGFASHWLSSCPLVSSSFEHQFHDWP